MIDVSRETGGPPDRYSAFPALAAYARILATIGVDRGLIGPREVPRLWPRHLQNCAVVAEEERRAIPAGAHVADIGSGAGLPGIVWAIVRPDLDVTLVEPLLRRSTFLAEVVAELGLAARVHVLRARAEAVTAASFDVVTARAVARLDRLVPWTLPLVRVGGWLVALKGAGALEEAAEAAAGIRTLGGAAPVVRAYGAAELDPPTTAILVHRESLGSPRQPRRRRS